MAALRVARTFTRRNKIALFAGAYHGWSDLTTVRAAGTNGELRTAPGSPGVPPNAVQDVVVLEYDSPRSLEYLKANLHELAAVLVEPVQSRRPDIQPKDFLQELRQLTEGAETALIFDEMITGFRSHPGGIQALYGIQADLVTYGKVIGGGLPIGIIAGRREYMDSFDGGAWTFGDTSYPQAEKMLFGGAFFKHPLTMAVACAVLEHLKRSGPSLQEQLNKTTASLVQQLNDHLKNIQAPIRMVHFSSLFQFVFDREVSATVIDLFFYHLVHKGVFVWEGRTCFLSTAHDAEDLEKIFRAVGETVDELRSAGFLNPGTPARSNGNHQVATPSIPAVSAAPATVTLTEKRQLICRTNQNGGGKPQFSLYFFGNYESAFRQDKYDLILEAAKFADQNGFTAIWIPERHFHTFGGFSPNPVIMAAALSKITERLQLRAGSVALPLHHPVRVAEEWSMVDNLSRGRIGVSFASGWTPYDFVFAPAAYEQRRTLTFEAIDTVRRLWRGEEMALPGGAGVTSRVKLFPMPMQPELPVWLTCARRESCVKAGEIGAGVLTNFQDQTVDDLALKISAYRDSLASNSFDPATGHVTVLLHTFVGDDLSRVRESARAPFHQYLKSHLGITRGALTSIGREIDFEKVSPEDMDYLISLAYDRYIQTSALVGTPDSCALVVDKLRDIGVDEIGCLIDFGVESEVVLEGLTHLKTLKEHYETKPEDSERESLTLASDPVISSRLSEAQRILWITSQQGDDASRAYNESTTLHLRGPFNVTAMRDSLEQLLARHEALRTTFSPTGEAQLIHRRMAVEIPLTDYSGLDEAEREAKARQTIANEAQQAFDLTSGPLIRIHVLRLQPQHHLLIITLHHIIIDGMSFGVLLGELSQLYSAACLNTSCTLPQPMPFRQFVEWQTEQQDEQTAKSERYWLEQFADVVPVLELPTDGPRPSVQTYGGGRERLRFPAALYQQLRTFSAQQRATMIMVLLAAYKILLSRLAGQYDLVVGIAAAGQALVTNERLVGYCVNLLPLRSRIQSEARFNDVLATIKRGLIGAFEHQDYPFGRLLQKLNLRTDASRAPLVSAAFNVDALGTVPRFHDLEVEVEMNSTNAARFDLYLHIIETEGDTILEFDYRRDLFEVATIRRWLSHYSCLLEAILKNSAQRVSELPLLTESEREQMLVAWNNTDTVYPKDRCVHELFEARVESAGEAVAVVMGDEQVSYRELNARANQLAHYLRRAGVGPEVLVGLLLERSVAMVVAQLAVLKAGGAYVPLDPQYPAARLGTMLREAGVKLLVTEQRWQAMLGDEAVGQVISLDSEAQEIARESERNVGSGVGAENLAYVIYTSGSTGRPKGIAVTHQAINRLLFNTNYINLESKDRIAQLSSASFDAATFEIWGALLHGAQLVIFTKELSLSPPQFATEIAARGITTVFVTTALFNQFARTVPHAFSSLRQLLFGGEAVDPRCVREVLKHGPPQRLLHVYGPTESTTFATWYLVQDVSELATNLPIGGPLSNTQLYVLDSNFELVATGAPGELFIGGDGLARGYLNRAGLTAERFVPNPFKEGQRLYRTGDIVRRLAGGEIEFLGRFDDQVKVRGFRIELGEIETVLSSHPAVESCVVLFRENVAGDDTKRLVAYLSAREGSRQDVSAGALRAYLKKRVPDYMLPSSYVVLQSFPLNPNGKIDRHALPAPDTSSDAGVEYAAPQMSIEQTLSAIWSRVLGVRQVGTDDNFFDLGGDSILSIQIAARAQKEGLSLRPNQLFQYQTIAELAKVVGADMQAVEAEQGIVTGTVPLTPIQSWFLEHQVAVDPHHWNQSVMLEAREPLDLPVLEKAIHHLLMHHDALRMRFRKIATGWEQFNDDREDIAVCSELDFSAMTDEERRDAMRESATGVQKRLDLAHGPLIRLAHFKSSKASRLLLTAHHLVVDGVSWRIFLEDLARVYEQLSRNEVVELGPKTTSFKQWSERLSEYAQTAEMREQVNYWTSQFAAPFASLPLDHSNGPNTVASEDTAIVMFEPEETAALLKQAPRLHHCLTNELLIAALGRSLSHWTSSPRVLIDLEGHGREELFPDTNLSRTIGWFTTIFPLVLQIDPDREELTGIVKHVKEKLRAVPLRGIGYGLLRYLCRDDEVRRKMRALPQAQVSFNYLGQFAEDAADAQRFRLTGEATGATRAPRGQRSYLLDVVAVISGGTLQISVTYSRNQYRRETIEKLAGSIKRDLQSLVTHPHEERNAAPWEEFGWQQAELEEITAVISEAYKA